MILIVSKFLVPSGYRALTVFPFVFVRENGAKEDAVLLNHEQIHLAQQKELLLVGFLIWYVLEYLWRLAQYKNHQLAYRNILFEREAYSQEQHLGYLKTRNYGQFLKLNKG
mgnify:FL=1